MEGTPKSLASRRLNDSISSHLSVGFIAGHSRCPFGAHQLGPDQHRARHKAARNERTETMRIISTPLPSYHSELVDNRLAIVMAFDTLVEEKPLVVGFAVGSIHGPKLTDVRLSRVGELVVERCCRHMELNYPHAPTVIAGVAQVAGAKERVRQVLAKAPPQAFVLLLCANDKVYDAAYPALSVDFQAAHQRPQ